jgi:hypothetical protein
VEDVDRLEFDEVVLLGLLEETCDWREVLRGGDVVDFVGVPGGGVKHDPMGN